VSFSREVITSGDWSLRARTRTCDVTRVGDEARLAEGPRRAGSGARIGRLVRTSACLDAQFRTVVVGVARKRAENARALGFGSGRECPCLCISEESRECPCSRIRIRPRMPVPLYFGREPRMPVL